MTQLWAWEYEGKTEFGWKHWERTSLSLYVAQDSSVSPIRDTSKVTNLRPAKVVEADAVVISKELWEWIDSDDAAYGVGWIIKEKIISENPRLKLSPPTTKTYLTTDQFIKVWKSFDDDKYKELKAAWDAAWDAARYADLAVLVKDKISDEHFEILTKPWTSCGLSLYAEDWDEVLNPKVVEHPKVVEPKNFGAIVEASTRHYGFQSWFLAKNGTWTGENEHHIDWSDLINPIIISEGVE